MKSTFYLGLMAFGSAVALPLDATPTDCSCLSNAVSSLSADPLASAFCSQFVGVSTVVVSTTITTPAATTVVVKTVPGPFTITETFVDYESTVSFLLLLGLIKILTLIRVLRLRRLTIFLM